MKGTQPASAGARADLCRFLAACYYEPCGEFIEENLFDSMRDAAAAVAPELEAEARVLGAAFAAESLRDLLIDYTQLFLGPVEALAKPYESVWIGSQAPVDRTAALTKIYREAGFDVDEGFRDLPDHVAVELEFLYLLIFQRADDLEQRFLDMHLGRWIGPFSEAVGSGARSEFYRRLAELTGRFVRMETERCRKEIA